MPKKDPTYDRIERALFKDREEASSILSQREMEIKKRMMLCVSKKMEDPLIQDTELVNFLMNGCGGNADAVSQSQAYRDIGMINRLVGNIQLAAKAWYRYMIVEGGKKAFSMAIDKEDAKGAAAALDKIGKYTRTKKMRNSTTPSSFLHHLSLQMMLPFWRVWNLLKTLKEPGQKCEADSKVC
jgi:hypothetical protein